MLARIVGGGARALLVVVIVLAIVTLSPTGAIAYSVGDSVDYAVTADNAGAPQVIVQGSIVPEPTGDFGDSGVTSTGDVDVDWAVSGNVDPVLIATFAVVNRKSTTETFAVTITLPVSEPVGPTSISSGLVDVDLVNPGFLPAALSAPAGGAVYSAYIDGVLFKQLMLDPTVVSADPFGVGGLTETFGLPGQTEPGPPVTSDIHIEYVFTLTPGAQASINGNFVIFNAPAVPEPFTAAMLGLTSAALLRRRR